MPSWDLRPRNQVPSEKAACGGDCERHGWRPMKSRRSEEDANRSGGFMMVESLTGTVLAGGNPHAFSMTLDEVGDYVAARLKRTRR